MVGIIPFFQGKGNHINTTQRVRAFLKLPSHSYLVLKMKLVMDLAVVQPAIDCSRSQCIYSATFSDYSISTSRHKSLDISPDNATRRTFVPVG